MAGCIILVLTCTALRPCPRTQRHGLAFPASRPPPSVSRQVVAGHHHGQGFSSSHRLTTGRDGNHPRPRSHGLLPASHGSQKSSFSQRLAAGRERSSSSSSASQPTPSVTAYSQRRTLTWRHHRLLAFGICQLPFLQSFGMLLLTPLLPFGLLRDLILPRSRTRFFIHFRSPRLNLGVRVLLH